MLQLHGWHPSSLDGSGRKKPGVHSSHLLPPTLGLQLQTPVTGSQSEPTLPLVLQSQAAYKQ